MPKKIDITKEILAIVAPHLTADNLPEYLLSEGLYHKANHAAKNWQELYVDYYGLPRSAMLLPGSMWAEQQKIFNQLTERAAMYPLVLPLARARLSFQVFCQSMQPFLWYSVEQASMSLKW